MTIQNKYITGFNLSLSLHDTLNIFLPAKRKNKANFPCFLYMDPSQDRKDEARSLEAKINKKFLMDVL